MTAALIAEGLHTYYGKSHILHGVSLAAEEGKITALLGRNGAGKTTTLRSLMGLTPARDGKITIFNGEQWRPFMHVHDAARAFLACLEVKNLDVISGEIFNAGAYDLNHRLSELGGMIAKVIPAVNVERVENDDRRNYRVTFDKIHTRIGFTCERENQFDDHCQYRHQK